MSSISIAGTKLPIVDAPEALAMCQSAIQSHRPIHLVTANPEYLVQAQRRAGFRRVLQETEGALVDGAGLLFFLRLRGIHVARTTGVDFVEHLCEEAALKHQRVFFLGAQEGVAALSADALKERYPKLIIAGTYAGSPAQRDFAAIKTLILEAKPDILLVAFGSPTQDLWIAKTQKILKVPVALGVGGAFDFIAGRVRRAPVWMQTIGLEWLWRLILQPWRIARIWNAVVVFTWLALKKTKALDSK